MSAEPAPQAPSGWIVPAVIGAALMMQTLSANVIVTALPAMAHAFNEDPLRLNLAITVYLLATAVFLPVSGWMADKFGAKRILLIAMVLYALGSAACGLAQNLPQLIAARFAEGAAGAMMSPVARLVLLRSVRKEELVSALAVVTMPALIGPVIGPLLGGAIITFFDWRWIFFINLPIAAVGVALVKAYVPDIREEEAPPLDILGVTLVGLGLSGLIFGFENLGRSFLPQPLVATIFLGGFAVLGLYWAHSRTIAHPAVDMTVFRLKTFRAGTIGGGFTRIALGATPFLLTMLLQVAFGMSAFAAGLMTFMSSAGAFLMKACAPRTLRRFGFRQVLIFNGLITAASFAGFAFFHEDTPKLVILAVLGFSGFFRSLQFTSLNGLAYADLESHQMSRGTTVSAMAQQLVQSIGVGLAAALVRTFMAMGGATEISREVIAPTFVVMGAVSLISLFWFVKLPGDAGAQTSGRKA